jgi:hypothetical protein
MVKCDFKTVHEIERASNSCNGFDGKKSSSETIFKRIHEKKKKYGK